MSFKSIRKAVCARKTHGLQKPAAQVIARNESRTPFLVAPNLQSDLKEVKKVVRDFVSFDSSNHGVS